MRSGADDLDASGTFRTFISLTQLLSYFTHLKTRAENSSSGPNTHVSDFEHDQSVGGTVCIERYR
jgi:hypothetical protein